MKPDIYHVEYIGSGSLSVMAKPESGQRIDDEFKGIRDFGIDRIVSLLEKQEAIDLGLGQEDLLAKKYDMEFVSFPIQDMGLPNSVEQYLQFSKRLHEECAGGLHTVVHCHAGIGRSGIIAAGVLLCSGYDPHDAISHISTKRGMKIPDTQKQIDWVVSCHKAKIKRFQSSSCAD